MKRQIPIAINFSGGYVVRVSEGRHLETIRVAARQQNDLRYVHATLAGQEETAEKDTKEWEGDRLRKIYEKVDEGIDPKVVPYVKKLADKVLKAKPKGKAKPRGKR